jgi:hypothetical protein
MLILGAVAAFTSIGYWMNGYTSLGESTPGRLPAISDMQTETPANLSLDAMASDSLVGSPSALLPDAEDLKARAHRGEWSAFLVAAEADERCGYFWMGSDFARADLPPPPPSSPSVAVWRSLWESESLLCASKDFPYRIAPYTTTLLKEIEGTEQRPDDELRRRWLSADSSDVPISEFLDVAARRATSPDELGAILVAGFSGKSSRVLELPGASAALSGQRFRPERRALLLGYAARLVACQRGAACPAGGALQVGACLREYNCAPGLPADRFIRERLLLPGEREAVDALALLIEQELRRRGA